MKRQDILQKRIITKVVIGKEYLYDPKYYQVSKTKADIVCAAMNKANYQLKPGEIWKVQETDDYTYNNAFYRTIVRNNKVRFYEIWQAI